MMDYQITATLGPASSSPEVWKGMVEAGTSRFRLNTSHLSLPELLTWLERLEDFLSGMPDRPAVVLDLQGSKWRLGSFSGFDLQPGETVELRYADAAGQAGVLPVPHLDFFQAREFSAPEIVLNDAKVHLRVETYGKEIIRARVVQGGPIAANKGITYASSDYRKEELNQKDQSVVQSTRNFPQVQYAISYIRDAHEMQRYRAILGEEIFLAAKLERPQAVLEVQHIAGFANELWVCRGDLGAEMGLAGMAEAVSHVSQRVQASPIPVWMAGQVLEHMTAHAQPTRSEVCYLFDSLQHGYAGFVLSDETAIGNFPVESCRAAALFRSPPQPV
jgi:pyruvate kinase